MDTVVVDYENLADLGFYPLAKTAPDGPADAADVGEGPWKFRGIASDTSQDVEGDDILRKHLDLTYADSRGFVNWDHSKAPEDQVGFLHSASLITPAQVSKFQAELGDGVKLSKSASVYVEGELYQYVARAEHVANLIKSAPPGKGIGLSLQGAMARDAVNGDIVRAFVRGIAITPVPAHPRTLVNLTKSLRAAQEAVQTREGSKDVSPEVLRAIEVAVAAQVSDLRKAIEGEPPKMLTLEDAVMTVFRKHPEWSYTLAKDVVLFAIQKENA